MARIFHFQAFVNLLCQILGSHFSFSRIFSFLLSNSWLAFFTFQHFSIFHRKFLARISQFLAILPVSNIYVLNTLLYSPTLPPPPKPPSSHRVPLGLLGRGGGVLVEIFISSGNKHQIQANHIQTHRKNLYFVLKAIPGLNYKFTQLNKCEPRIPI